MLPSMTVPDAQDPGTVWSLRTNNTATCNPVRLQQMLKKKSLEVWRTAFCNRNVLDLGIVL